MSSVGDLIDAYCLRCKLTLSHVVMYESGGTIDKVKCRTCGAEHKYRGPKPEIKSGATRSKKAKTGSASSASTGRQKPTLKEWTQKHEDLKEGANILPYSIRDPFNAGDVIRHPTFGVGFVERVISDTRMDVLFHDALRRMAMNMKTP